MVSEEEKRALRTLLPPGKEPAWKGDDKIEIDVRHCSKCSKRLIATKRVKAQGKCTTKAEAEAALWSALLEQHRGCVTDAMSSNGDAAAGSAGASSSSSPLADNEERDDDELQQRHDAVATASGAPPGRPIASRTENRAPSLGEPRYSPSPNRIRDRSERVTALRKAYHNNGSGAASSTPQSPSAPQMPLFGSFYNYFF